MAHAGFSVESPAQLAAAHDFFKARSRVLMAADFGIAWSVMGADPDGNVIEFELFHVGAVSAEPGFAELNLELLRDGAGGRNMERAEQGFLMMGEPTCNRR